MTKVLVTGASGFIGSHLVKELIKRNNAVRGLFLPDENVDEFRTLGVEVFRGDLTKPDTLRGIAAGIDIVHHLATRTLDWGSRRQFERIMVDGTRHLLAESVGNVSRFVYYSSIAALGLGRNLYGLDEDAERIKCGIPYCDAKIIAEDVVKNVCEQSGLAYTIIRPANVIGPGSVWVKEILDGFRRGPVPLINGGEAPGAFVYVQNLVEGTILAGEATAAGNRVYHFIDDYPITWKAYLTAIGAMIGKKTTGNLPFGLAWKLGGALEAIFTPLGVRPPITRLAVGVMGKNLAVDNRRARQELGWQSRISQEQAMQEIAAWVQRAYLGGGNQGNC